MLRARTYPVIRECFPSDAHAQQCGLRGPAGLLTANEMPSRRIGQSVTQSAGNTSLALADNTSLLLHDSEIVTKVLPYSGFNGLLLASVGLERTDKARTDASRTGVRAMHAAKEAMR